MKKFYVGLLALFGTSVLYAECTPDKSITECIEGDMPTASSATSTDDSQEILRSLTLDAGARLSQTLTGGTASGDSAGLDDFNPLMALSALSGINDSGSGLEFSTSDFLNQLISESFIGLSETPLPAPDNHYKLVVQKLDAEIFSPLDQIITDTAVRQTILDSIGDYGNLDISLRYAPAWLSRGRALSSYAGWISQVQAAVPDEAKNCNRDEFAFEIYALFDDLDFETPLDQLYHDDQGNADITQAQATANIINRLIDEENQLAQECYDTYRKNLLSSGIENLALLVDNQSQLVLSLDSKIRDQAAGPDELSATIKFEFGGVNLDNMEAVCASRSDKINCMNDFVLTNNTAIRAGHRFSGSIEYIKREAYSFNNLGVTFSQQSFNSLIAQIGYGRKVKLGFLPLNELTQIDFTASYEDVDNDPLRQNRSVANATFSHQLAEGVSLSVGFVWANKPEYRGEVDEEFSALTGITYKLPNF